MPPFYFREIASSSFRLFGPGVRKAWLVSMLVLYPIFTHAQDAVSLVEDGRPVATIYAAPPLYSRAVIETAMPRLRGGAFVTFNMGGQKRVVRKGDLFRSAAVIDLVYHVQKMSGARLKVVPTRDPMDISGPAVVLGALANASGAAPDTASPSDEEFRITTSGDRVLIGGRTDLAVRHGVYTLLNRMGVDWVMPGEIGEIIPKKKTVTVPHMDFADRPDFSYRRLWYRGFRPRIPEERVRFQWWLWRHKSNNNPDSNDRTAGHVWGKFIKRHQDEFDADPTMLALVTDPDGQKIRRGPQIETTHPRVIELFAEEIRNTFKANIAAGVWTRETAAGFGIGPADGLGYSISPEATAAGSGRIDPIIGDPDQTDQLVLMANRILAAVSDEFPNVRVGYYSYSAHADYPVRYVPDPRIAQIFAPINFSRFHSLTDPISKTQTFYREVVDKWAELSAQQGNRLSYRGYNWNLADNMLPYSKVRIWGEELPYYHARGFTGLNVEATKQWSVLAPSDYVFMRLAWDSSQDWRDLLEEFALKAYGDGARPMLRYWMRLIDTQREAGMEAGSYHAYPLIFDDTWVAAAQADLAEATRLAGTEADRARIRHVGIGVEFLRLYLDYHAATLNFDFTASRDLYQAMLAHWQQAFQENTDLVASEVPRYLARFLEDFTADAYLLSTGDFSIIKRVPDEMVTALDPNVAGERLGLHRPEIRDDRFIRTRTISSTWDAQGLGGFRDGAVWYRWRFNLPERLAGKDIGLFLGGVEDTAHVWLNGLKIGQAGPAFSEPMVFDLTRGLDGSGENLLAIQVIRTRKFNEIGLGGILRPSFLFTGPFEKLPGRGEN